jgi:hypothetical protein
MQMVTRTQSGKAAKKEGIKIRDIAARLKVKLSR